jgi:colicin import membrane protein
MLAAALLNHGLPALASLGLHALIVVFLLLNWTPRTEATITPRVEPRAIEARLVTVESLQPARKQAAAKPVQKSPAKPRPAPKPRPKPKPKPVAAKPEPEPTPEPVSKPAPSQSELASQAQRELAMALDTEDLLIQEATEQELTLSYVALIARTIEENWSRPPSARNEMEAELVLQLIPTGEVVSVAVARSSGNLAFDRSALNAVRKAERFPELQQLEGRVFERNFRQLRLRFKPEDLRY